MCIYIPHTLEVSGGVATSTSSSCRPLSCIAHGTSHCRTPACEGRPPVLGMVARCKVLTQSSITAPLLATPRGPTPLPRDCPQRGTHTSFPRSLTPLCEVLGFSSPPVSPGECLFYILQKSIPRPNGAPQAGTPQAHSAVQLAEASPGPFACPMLGDPAR